MSRQDSLSTGRVHDGEQLLTVTRQIAKFTVQILACDVYMIFKPVFGIVHITTTFHLEKKISKTLDGD